MSNKISGSIKPFTAISSGLIVAVSLAAMAGLSWANTSAKKPVGCYSYVGQQSVPVGQKSVPVGKKSGPVGKQSVPCTLILVASMTPKVFDRNGGTLVTIQGSELKQVSKVSVASARVVFKVTPDGKTITFTAPKFSKAKQSPSKGGAVPTFVVLEQVGSKGKILAKISLGATYK